MYARCEVLDEVKQKLDDGESLCFQKVTYHYSDGTSQTGYRFIRRSREGKMLPQRGQARIPDPLQAMDLVHNMIRR